MECPAQARATAKTRTADGARWNLPSEPGTLMSARHAVHALARAASEQQSSEMQVRSVFATRLYEADVGGETLLDELSHSIRSLAEDDEAGRRWSREHRYS